MATAPTPCRVVIRSEFLTQERLHWCLALGHLEGRILVLEIDNLKLLLLPLKLYPAVGILGQAPILFFQAQKLPSSLHLHYSLLIISPQLQRYLFVSF